MPFISKIHTLIAGKKIQLELMRHFDIKPNMAQKMLDRFRVYDEWGKLLKKGDTLISPTVEIIEFVGHSKGLKPLFANNELAIFDKPNDVLVHPVHRHTPYTLLDEVKFYFGNSANIVNRIDSETSGLVLVSRNKCSEKDLKTKFENKEYDKTYLAIVFGEVNESILIETPIKNDKNSKIGVKMGCFEDGKPSSTFIKPLKSTSKFSLLEITPYTGRQHQIRVHLQSINHPILGDPIYNASEDFADKYLNKDVSKEERIAECGDDRMWLHSCSLSFEYKKNPYKFISTNQDIFTKFAQLTSF